MNLKTWIFPVLFALMLAGLLRSSTAQTASDETAETILRLDSLFWKAYNACDAESMEQYFTADVEFYHDNDGPMFGLERCMDAIRTNLCGNSGFRLRREAVKGSVEVFPLAKGPDIYGAIISGRHLFYVRENGEDERLDGSGRFCQIWMLEGGVWKMSRILSYDHGPATRYLPGQ